MKNKKKVLWIALVVAAVIGFSMTACPSPAGGGGGDPGSGPARVAETVTYESKDITGVYVLVITENTTGRAAYTANPGDTYVLTFYPTAGGKKKSNGTVTSNISGKIELEPASATITITITINSAGKMTAIASDSDTGEITWDDGSVTAAPATLEPVIEDRGLSISSDGVLTYYYGDGGSVTIPNRVTRIGDHAFYGRSTLTSVIIPNSVISIGGAAFKETGLTSVTIPDSVTSIEGAVFQWCASLASITIPGSVTSIGDVAFQGCTTLTSVIIPDSVTSIGGAAFKECTSLTSITIPDSVISIGGGAFQWCALTSVTIPNSVKSIGYHAFWPCTKLNSVTFQGTITEDKLGSNNEWDNDIFTSPFTGNLREAYLAEGIGTYTTTDTPGPANPDEAWGWYPIWTRQP